ncbi:MAG: hypothetical protein AB7I79_18465 [Rhizobiaceae bacterium]
MPLLATAAVAMWWDVAEDRLAEFHEWHSKEHLPERLSIPGFNRGSRWQRGDAVFVIYELADYATLTSPAYRARLDNPTPWSTAMMPLHRNMVRSQARIVASRGAGIATFMATLRLSPAAGGRDALDTALRAAVAGLPERKGITGAHLLHTDTPAAGRTREQKIRGGDAAADWIFLVSGHDESALEAVLSEDLGPAALAAAGAEGAPRGEVFRLVHAMTPADVQGSDVPSETGAA